MIFSKVVNGIVESVVNVDDLQWIVDNPERYGDSSLYVETEPTDLTKQQGKIGFTYDAQKKIFVAPQPFASWILDAKGFWEAPKLKPEGNFYWDESTLSWLAFPVG